MMKLHRRILRKLRPTLLIASLLGVVLLGAWSTHAIGCWVIIESQCFNQTPIPQYWGQNGWQHPTPGGAYWWRYPNYPYEPVPVPPPRVSWDWQHRYFDTHMCQDDIQAIWCAGWPRSNDPQYVNYPPWDSAYVTYGPIDLSDAVAAGCNFYLYNRTELAHDSIFWGLTRLKRVHLHPDSMYIAGTYSQIMQNQDFQMKTMDFSQVHRYQTLDTISLLGESGLYVFWRFWSDGNSNTNLGSIIDNVSISKDNGGQDLTAYGGQIMRRDTTMNATPVARDTTFAAFTWATCPGGVENYPPFRAVILMDTMVVLDTVISGAIQGVTYNLYSHPWVLSPDTHIVRLVLDSLNEVSETDEANDTSSFVYVVPPEHPMPSFSWITPLDSTLYGDMSVTLRWEAYDDPTLPEPARVSIFSSSQSVSCQGIAIEGGTNRPVLDDVDSLVWNLTEYTYGQVRFLYAQVHDLYNDTCIHAAFPVIRRRSSSAGETGSLIPDRFYLDQNYPNPFNPTTELRYGVAKAGYVSLRVYDLLGREVAVLVNGDRSPGNYTATFDGNRLSSGLYLYTLKTPEGTESRKMMLMK